MNELKKFGSIRISAMRKHEQKTKNVPHELEPMMQRIDKLIDAVNALKAKTREASDRLDAIIENALADRVKRLEAHVAKHETIYDPACHAIAEVQGIGDTLYGDRGDGSKGLKDRMADLEAQGKEDRGRLIGLLKREDEAETWARVELAENHIDALEKRTEELYRDKRRLDFTDSLMWDKVEALEKRVEALEHIAHKPFPTCGEAVGAVPDTNTPAPAPDSVNGLKCGIQKIVSTTYSGMAAPEPVCETCGKPVVDPIHYNAHLKGSHISVSPMPSCQPAKSCETKEQVLERLLWEIVDDFNRPHLPMITKPKEGCIEVNSKWYWEMSATIKKVHDILMAYDKKGGN